MTDKNHTEGDKSVTQTLSDSTSTKPGEESYVDSAKKAVGDAVEYVEKTATGTIPPSHDLHYPVSSKTLHIASDIADEPL